ncbi:hypothetical protein ABW21_db0207568 [Orbilia brochopaga]|nr:hypothetical protein ABW21_db0207568 [Drechslerella brochopaga]
MRLSAIPGFLTAVLSLATGHAFGMNIPSTVSQIPSETSRYRSFTLIALLSLLGLAIVPATDRDRHKPLVLAEEGSIVTVRASRVPALPHLNDPRRLLQRLLRDVSVIARLSVESVAKD